MGGWEGMGRCNRLDGCVLVGVVGVVVGMRVRVRVGDIGGGMFGYSRLTLHGLHRSDRLLTCITHM
jgi:hypothetical protein